MAPEVKVIALDTNLLIYAHRGGAPQSRRAQRAIQLAAEHPEGWGYALASVAEFWCIVTHPSNEADVSTPQQANEFLNSLRQAGARLFLPGNGFGERLTQLAADLEIQGPNIFDLVIALTVFESGAAEIWTHDAAFVSLPGLRVHNPLSGRS